MQIAYGYDLQLLKFEIGNKLWKKCIKTTTTLLKATKKHQIEIQMQINVKYDIIFGFYIAIQYNFDFSSGCSSWWIQWMGAENP